MTRLLEWLVAPRQASDSAIWAIAFTLNTWASTMETARAQAYAKVRNMAENTLRNIEGKQWLDLIEKQPESVPRANFLRALNQLLDYVKSVRARYSEEQCARKWFAKRVMGLASFLSVLCIFFEWYYNGALALLLPYPAFRFWIGCVEARMAVESRVRSMLVEHKFKLVVRTSTDAPPPSVAELRERLRNHS